MLGAEWTLISTGCWVSPSTPRPCSVDIVGHGSIIGTGPLSTFFAAAFVAFMGEILARKLKKPAIIFTIPGILPLSPGLGIYNTMLYMVQKDFEKGFSKGIDTISIAASIALGILVVTSINNSYNILSKRNLSKNN